MLTATKDLPLATTVTGSWPRPHWFNKSMWGRPLSACMMEIEFREQFTDALTTCIADQERAGLDILTPGDLFLDADLAGRSWHHYPLQRWSGLTGDKLQTKQTRNDLLAYPAGTLLHEIFTSWRWPHIVGKIEPDPDNPLEYAKIYRLAQARTKKPVKFGTVSAQVMAQFLDVHTDLYDQDDKRQVIWDMATAINQELREVVAAGCKVIQVEEPTIHFTAAHHPDQTEWLDFLVDALNHEISGLDGAEVWVHTCWGNPMMQRVYDKTSYADSIELYMERVNADVWTVEMKDRGQADLELFGRYRGQMNKKVAIGVVSHRSLQADTPNDVAAEIRAAIEHIEPENLIVSSDCGFGRQGANRTIAFYKAAAIAQGANIVRRELGLPETEVPAANESMQVDMVLDD